MADAKFTPVRDISPESPLMAYARDAVAEARRDYRTDVVIRRIADYLATQILGQPWINMDNLPTNADPEFYLGMARVAVALMVSIDHEAPPTRAEILRCELHQAIALARARVRCIGGSNRHRLSTWKPDAVRHGVELVKCMACAAWATLNLESGEASLSDELRGECAGRRA